MIIHVASGRVVMLVLNVGLPQEDITGGKNNMEIEPSAAAESSLVRTASRRSHQFLIDELNLCDGLQY